LNFCSTMIFCLHGVQRQMGKFILKRTTPIFFPKSSRIRSWHWKMTWHATITHWNLCLNYIFEFWIFFVYFHFYTYEIYNSFSHLSTSYGKETCRFWVLQLIFTKIQMMIPSHLNEIIIQFVIIWKFPKHLDQFWKFNLLKTIRGITTYKC
jgi:hypothetical protein